MAISFVAAGAVATGTNPVVAVPAGYEEGDLFVLTVAVGAAVAPSTPSGWTLLGSQTTTPRIYIYTKFSGVTESSVTVTVNSTTTAAVMAAYRGVSNTDTISTFATATSTTVATNTLTTTYANEYVVSVYAMTTGAATWTAPGSTTTRVDSAGTASVAGILIVDESQASAGTSTARTATSSANKALAAGSFSIIPSGRYWVGGSAVWNNTAGTKWSFTDGGAGGAPVPTSRDDVTFTAKPAPTWQASTAYILTNYVSTVTGNGFAYECTTAGTTGISEPTWPTVVGNTVTDGTVVWTCRLAESIVDNVGVFSKNFDSTNYQGRFGATSNNNVTYNIYGNITIGANVNDISYAYIIFSARSTGTIISNGKLFPTFIINAADGTVTLGDALNLSTRNLTVTAGTFSTSASNYSITANSISANVSNTRTINLNASTVTLSTASTAIDFTNPANLTLNAGTSQINLTSTATIIGGDQTFYNVSFTNTVAGTQTITGANTFNNLSLTASASGLSQLAIGGNQTINGTFTCAGTSVTQRGFVRSDTPGTSRTLTVATLSANDCDFRDITIAGVAAGGSPTRAGDCGGNSGITFPSPKTVYWNLTGTQNWNATGWATTNNGTPAVNNFPLPQDTATFTNSGSAGTVSLAASYNTGVIDASGRTSAMTLSHNASHNIYGSYTLGSGVTVSGTSTQTFSGRSTMTFTSAGKTITFPITVDAPSNTFQLGDAFSSSSSITHTRGTFSAVTYNVTSTTFASSNSNTRTVNMGSGTWTLSGTGTVWSFNTTTNLTFNKDTANIVLSNTSTSARTFAGGGLTYNKLTIGGATGTSTLTINEANTFSELASTKTVAHTITFGADQTVTTWSITGTSGNVVTLNSSAAGTARTITKSGGGFLTGIDYLNIRDVVGSPVSDTWYIGSNSVYNTTSPNVGYGLFTTQRADNAVVVLDSTSSTTWTVPSDWNNSTNTIHLIGGGGGGAGAYTSSSPKNTIGGGGGGGGGYTQLTNQTLTIGASITYQAGSAGGGGPAQTNGTAGGTTSWNGGAATAGGGGGGQATTTTSTGGTAGTGTTFNGGAGGTGSLGISVADSAGAGAGAGGGAGGPNGAGGNGGNGFGPSVTGGINVGGGGGGNGGGTNGGNGTSGTGGTGGNNSSGVGGGASNVSGSLGGGAGGSDGSSTIGGNGIDIFGIGSGGGGGGGCEKQTTHTGGLYGAGGGGGGVDTGGGRTSRPGSSGAQGAIIVVYTPSAVATATGNFLMFM